MASLIFGVILTLLLACDVQCEGPPEIKESFIAWGEITQPLLDDDSPSSVVIQIDFEESYDARTENAAFFMRYFGKNITFVKNYDSNQTFFYLETNDKKLHCAETDEMQWTASDVAPGLLSYEDDDGTVKFSLKQLLNIPSKYLTDQNQGVATTYREIPAKSWTYQIDSKDDENNDVTIKIKSYWSDGSWNTSAGPRMTPLGFNVNKTTVSTLLNEDYVINVFGFAHDAYDRKYFEPFQGIVCATKNSTMKFPDVKNIKAMSIHSELALPDYQELRYVDTWFDPSNGLVRVDVERFKDEDPLKRKQKPFQSEIAVAQMNTVFRWGYYKGESECKIIPFDKYENDLQNLFDIKQDLKKWKMGKIFGLNDTSYTYIGQTIKNNIPCHLFQGMRSDWPDTSSGIQSLWEWCFHLNMNKENNILFLGGEFGLISANIIILSDEKKVYNDYRMNHHFYEVKAQDPQILDATRFDISRCFRANESRPLQFYLDVAVGADNMEKIQNATSDVVFLQRWKAAIYNFAGLPSYSLRVSNVRATIDDKKVFIKFSILDVHKDLSEAIKKDQISAVESEKKFTENVNSGKVSIMYSFGKEKPTTLKAKERSVSWQIDPNFKPQTLPPLPKTTPTTATPVFTLRTPAPEGNKDTVEYIGHQPGSVAGVAVSMLLIGVSIGAGGTFCKFFGLPSCMRR